MLAFSFNVLLLVLVPLTWLLALAARTPGSWSGRALSLAACLLYVVLVFVAGAGWAVVGWYTRWALPVVVLPLAVLAAVRARGARAFPTGAWGWVGAAASLAAAVYIGSGLVLLGESNAPPAASVQNPLGAGAYLVHHGGDNAVQNGHHEVRAQRYALDILGLNGAGFNASSPGSRTLEEYAIYGVPLHAPCTGEVLVARDDSADMPVGPSTEAGRAAPYGNTVFIHCESDDFTVVLAHMKPQSLRVGAGQRVVAGDVLGAVGNSGNSSEPHLHLHGVRGRVADPGHALADAEPVPLRIDGRSLVRNDRLVVPSVGAQAGGSS
jgi:hypothetical protein